MFRQLSAETDVGNVKEEGSTANSCASHNESKNRYRHSVRMPRSLFPCVRKIVHRGSKFFRTQNRKQAEAKERDSHEQCCGYITGIGDRPSLHRNNLSLDWTMAVNRRLHSLTPRAPAGRSTSVMAISHQLRIRLLEVVGHSFVLDDYAVHVAPISLPFPALLSAGSVGFDVRGCSLSR